jgi:hypothetical protein
MQWRDDLMPDFPAIPQTAINAAAGSAVITSIFYASTQVLQRLAGAVRVHSGRSYPLTVAWGASSTVMCLVFTHYNAPIISQTLYKVCTNDIPAGLKNVGVDIGAYLPSRGRKAPLGICIDYSPGRRWWQSQHSLTQQDAKQLFLGLSAYAIFERRAFRTALPSSLITTGAFAHTPVHWHRKLPNVLTATSEVASSAQRRIIQQLGKIHGCHHCGSRQIPFPFVFNTAPTFIADHMPPTKVIKEKNLVWYRQMSGILAKQQLLPQCQTCFSRQGQAVRSNVHILAYHQSFRAWHFAPAIGYLLLLSEQQALISSGTSNSSAITGELVGNLASLPYRLLQECYFIDAINWLASRLEVLQVLEFVEFWIKFRE